MSHRVRHGFALASTACIGLLAPVFAGSQELVLDASVKVGALQPQLRRYTATVGKETVLESNSLYRVVMIPTSLSSGSVAFHFTMLNSASNRPMAVVTSIAKIGKKSTLMHVGYDDWPDHFKIDAMPSVK